MDCAGRSGFKTACPTCGSESDHRCLFCDIQQVPGNCSRVVLSHEGIRMGFFSKKCAKCGKSDLLEFKQGGKSKALLIKSDGMHHLERILGKCASCDNRYCGRCMYREGFPCVLLSTLDGGGLPGLLRCPDCLGQIIALDS